jgi:alkylated DNA repair dioxygenase AlkB
LCQAEPGFIQISLSRCSLTSDSVARAIVRSLRLASGDVVILAGDARHFFHGIGRIMPGTSRLPDAFPETLQTMGIRRINLTLRRVTK